MESEEKFLQIKRHRDLSGLLDEQPRYTQSMYLDYWIEKERIYPIAIRIYNKHRAITDTYIYEIDNQLLLKIASYYKNRKKKPYWVSHIAETYEQFSISLAAHFEQYDIAWLPSADAVKSHLEHSYVKLYVITNHVEYIELFYNINIISVDYVRSETVYQADFLAKVFQIEDDPTKMNNLLQAISSVKTRIEKVCMHYPAVRNHILWQQLGSYFKPL